MENTNAQEQVKFNKGMIADIKNLGKLAMRPLRKLKQIQPKLEELKAIEAEAQKQIDNISNMIEDMCGYPMNQVLEFVIEEKTHTMKPVFIEPVQDVMDSCETQESVAENKELPQEGTEALEPTFPYSEEEMTNMSEEQ